MNSESAMDFNDAFKSKLFDNTIGTALNKTLSMECHYTDSEMNDIWNVAYDVNNGVNVMHSILQEIWYQ